MIQEEVKKRFYYAQGNLYYKNFSGHMMVGDKAGTTKKNIELSKKLRNKNITVISVIIDKKTYRLDKLIYLYHFGIYPENIIHKDNDNLNCKITNLKLSNNKTNVNKLNGRKTVKNPKNYYYNKTDKTYFVKIGGLYIGTYKTESMAQLVVKDLKDKLYKYL